MLRHSSARIGCRKLDRQLKRIGRTLGPDRELDVTIQDARIYGLDSRQLKPLRKRARRRIRRCLSRDCRKRIQAGLEAACRRIRKQKSLSLDPAYSLMRQELRSWEPERRRAGSRTHLFRVAVKKARYRLEFAGQPVERLHVLQDTLGEARDLALLQRHLGAQARARRDQRALEARARRLAVPAIKSALRSL
jgi:CHAD domain-containing protein